MVGVAAAATGAEIDTPARESECMAEMLSLSYPDLFSSGVLLRFFSPPRKKGRRGSNILYRMKEVELFWMDGASSNLLALHVAETQPIIRRRACRLGIMAATASIQNNNTNKKKYDCLLISCWTCCRSLCCYQPRQLEAIDAHFLSTMNQLN